MRFIDRNSILPPASLTDPNSKAATERSQAIHYYTQVSPPEKSFPFKAYKSNDIVVALESLFHKKCAYCESKYAGTQPADVEHFRPKGAVAEEKNHLGYWWLALEWSNLLPSCIDCNRKRKQYLVDSDNDGLIAIATEKELAGKKDAFPLATAHRAHTPSDRVEDEKPLLINPTVTIPEKHLGWELSNLTLPIAVPHFIGDEEDQIGRNSIDVFGLNRHGLVEQRAALLQELKVEIEKIREILILAAAMPVDNGKGLVSTAESWIRKLVRHINIEQKYSAVASTFIRKEIQILSQEFELALKVATHETD